MRQGSEIYGDNQDVRNDYLACKYLSKSPVQIAKFVAR